MRSDILGVLNADFYKLSRSRTKFVVPAGFILIIVFLFIGLSTAAQRNFFGIPSGFYISSACLGWMVNIIVLCLVVITSFEISNEFAMGTVKSVLVRPLTRHAWLTAKTIYVCLIAAVLLASASIVVICLAWFKFGLTGLTENNYVIHSARSLEWKLFIVLILTLWNLCAVVNLSVAISTIFYRPGSSISTLLALSLLMVVLGIFPVLKGFLLTTFVSLPFEQMTAMTKGLPLPLSWSNLIWRTLVVSGAYMIISIAAGQLIIARKEITF